MRNSRALFSVVFLSLCAGLLSACGGGGGGDQSARQVVSQTFKGKKNIRSARLDFSLKLDAKGVEQLEDKPLTLTLKGPFQSQGKRKLPKFDITLQASAAGQSFNAGAVSTGEKGFVKFQGRSYVAGDQLFESFRQRFETAGRQAKGGKTPSLSSLGVDATKWLKDPENEGSETVGGVETTHVSSGVDVGVMMNDLNRLISRAASLGLAGGASIPSNIPAKTREQIEDAVKDVKLDIWTGAKDKILRKLQLALEFEVPEDARDGAGGLESGKLDLTVLLDQVNRPQTVRAPAGARPISELLGDLGPLGGLLSGGLGGASTSSGSATIPSPSGGGSGSGSDSGNSGSGSGSSGSGGGSSESKRVQQYTACIQSAQGAAELERCAELLR